jgi:hypothetical protein
MSRPLFTNNASTVLARAITPTDTILQLTAGTGQYFPQPTIGDYFMLTLVQVNNPEVSEIVECIERVGDVLTVVRGQEGTAPQIFNISDSVELRITAGSLNLFAIGGGGGGSASGTSVADFTATQNQTVFTLPWSYTQGIDNLAIFINGSKQVVNVNYTESTSTSFTMAAGLNAGDIVQAIYNLPLAGGVISSSNVTYNEQATGAVNRTVQSKLQESVSVLDFGADPTGVSDSSTAFQNAINALSSNGGTILVPTGTYLLNTTPTWGTKSIFWNISTTSTFTGSGGGAGHFPIMATNGGQLAVGPFIQSQSSTPSSAGGGIAAFNVEMLQPSTYVGQSVALYAGAKSNSTNAASNVWCFNTVIEASASAGGIFTGYEMDVNNFSPTAYVKGLSVTGLGTYNPDIGIEIVRVTGTSWKIGQLIQNSNDALVINGQTNGRGIIINPPGSSNIPIGNTALTMKQFANNSETILMQRNTDTTPTGFFLRAVNAANSVNLVEIDVLGNIVGNSLQVTGAVTSAPSNAVSFSAVTATTATAGSGNLPSNVAGFLEISVFGATKKIPYYNV